MSSQCELPQAPTQTLLIEHSPDTGAYTPVSSSVRRLKCSMLSTQQDPPHGATSRHTAQHCELNRSFGLQLLFWCLPLTPGFLITFSLFSSAISQSVNLEHLKPMCAHYRQSPFSFIQGEKETTDQWLQLSPLYYPYMTQCIQPSYSVATSQLQVHKPVPKHC